MEPLKMEELDWFQQWISEQGEELPDLSGMPSHADLPGLLVKPDGQAIRTDVEWSVRKEELKEQLRYWFLGDFPQEIPALADVRIMKQETAHGAHIRELVLTFATMNQAAVEIELMIPAGEGPYPLFMTQSNHRRWGLLALSRGYAVCVYPGSDMNDQTRVFEEAYPECDWSLISRRAWLGSRVLDYVLTLGEIDPERIAIAGHSRNGKQALIAAAFDERFTAVVSSSSGSGGASPYRFSSESAFQESVEFMTRRFSEWFHPRLRLFTGREDKLPTDCHAILGLIAPRSCLISTAIHDSCESAFANERAYHAAKEVYALQRNPEGIRIRYRHGSHEVDAEDIEAYIDWLDHVFDRSPCGEYMEKQRLLCHFDWQAWRSLQGEPVPPPPGRAHTMAEKAQAVAWALGDKPQTAGEPGGLYGVFPPYMQAQFRHTAHKPPHIRMHAFNFGGYIRGNLYYRQDLASPAPVVIWLHPYSFSMGYAGAYMKNERIFCELADQGFAVVAYDQLGFGSRLLEGEHFYRRYPRWSKLGKMVADVAHAVDCVRWAAGSASVGGRASHVGETGIAGADGRLPELDGNRIYCVGYGLGGMVGLYAAALDPRIAGVASFSGFTPLRTDTNEQATGGIRRWWEWYGLLPRLGLYHSRESDIPYDWDDILALIAPRPCLIDSPLHDREHPAAEVADCVRRARAAWTKHGADDQLTHLMRNDYNRFQPEQHAIVAEWLKQVR